MSDCHIPGCDWTNLYATCTDGSREVAKYEHNLGHERVDPAALRRVGRTATDSAPESEGAV